MKKIFTLLVSSFLLISCYSNYKEVDKTDTYLILDTDLGFGFDDVGSIAMLHALADSSDVEIAGMVTSNCYVLSVPCIQIINSYFNRPGIAVGVTLNPNAATVSPQGDQLWTEELVRKYQHLLPANDSIPGAVQLYREILSKADEHSVTICSIGFLTNLSDLLSSPADAFSPLTGSELVRRKVKMLVVMGGQFPEGKEFNFSRDARAAYEAITGWPTEIIFSGAEIGSAVITGKRMDTLEGENNPIKDVYQTQRSNSNHFTGMSWDQTAVLVAVKGYDPFYAVERGRCMVKEDGSNTWIADPKGSHLLLIPKMPPEQVAEIIDHLMEHKPTR